MKRLITFVAVFVVGLGVGCVGSYIAARYFFPSYADRKLLLEPMWHTFDTAQRYCLYDEPSLANRWADVYVGLTDRLSNSNPTIRRRSVNMLAAWSDISLDTFLPLLNDTDPNVRYDATKSLARWGCPQAWQLMVERATPEEYGQVVWDLQIYVPDGPSEYDNRDKPAQERLAEWKAWLSDNMLYLHFQKGGYLLDREAQAHKVPSVYWSLLTADTKAKWDELTDMEKSQALLSAANKRAAINANCTGEGIITPMTQDN